MGFYGNITNTSRTTFSFDKIYSNRYDMDTSRGSDGVYVGRYVLVEYDTRQSADSYPEYYYYEGNMYGAVDMHDVVNGDTNEKLIYAPQVDTLITSKDIVPGTIVRVPVKKKVTGVNTLSQFVMITNVEETDNNTQIVNYKGISKGAFDEFLNNSYATVHVTADDYEPGKYYIHELDLDPTSDTYNEYIFKFDKKYFTSAVSNDSQYLAKTGANVKPENGLWVWVGTDAYGKEVNQYAALGLNGYYNTTTTWRKWWTDHFGRANFSFGYFDEYFELTKFDITKEYAIALKDNYFHVNLIETEWERNTYFIKNQAGEFVIDPGEEYDPNGEYYDRGIDTRELYITNEKLYFTTGYNFSNGQCFRIKASHVYTTNEDYQVFFMANSDGSWTELTFTTDSVYFNSKGDTTYLTNFAIDVAAYGTSRGYDSTVWQKVYTQGTEAYVMVAELNSVVPTFDLSADAPTMSPITPHFDSDTTNVYYKLHWQPSWGLRTKAASSALLGPQIKQDGTVGSIAMEPMTTDTVCYPSDVTTQWRGDFYNNRTGKKQISYYNIVTSAWDGAKGDDDVEIPAAIYFNKDGFDVDNIAYSDDLLHIGNEERYNAEVAESGWTTQDSIQLQPTGKSGHLYNSHSGAIDQKAQEDTQELSIMLPSIGDTIAKVWDIVFGGRETNPAIAETNLRNTDIEWENSHASLNRNGLRLVGDEKNAFSTASVNTIAGAINSAHDIMGMIITDSSKESLEARLENLDENRIYYNTSDHKYYRKHLTYDYTPKDDDTEVFTYTDVSAQLNEDNFDQDILFIKDENGKYIRVDKEAQYDSEQIYYTRTGAILEERTLTEYPDNLFYMDFTGSEYDLDPSQNMEMMDYIKDKKYHRGFQYYTIDESLIEAYVLSAGYKPGRFYYKVENDYMLDFNKGATDGRQYYNIAKNRVLDIADYGYNGIYIPGVYYYYDTNENAWKLDQDYHVNPNKIYYRPYATEITPGEGEEEEKIYRKEIDYQEIVPPDQATFERDMQLGKYYYKFENSALNVSLYTLYTGTWFQYLIEKPTLYSASVKYVLTQETNYEIDESTPYVLADFDMTAYFYEILDENGKLLGYHPITSREEIDPDDTTARYKAFISGWDKEKRVWHDWCSNHANPFAVPQEYKPDIENINSEIYLQYALHIMNLDTFYLPNKYHYKDNNGSYILDTYPTMTHNIYYIIKPTAIKPIDENIEFYEPYRYYRFNEKTLQYELIRKELTQAEIDEAPIYWKNELYVYKDELDKYSPGAVWNPHAIDEPDTITLATRKERYELKEIPDFARNLNTMHGLLLKLNQYMEYDDTYTRDERIANGLMNQLKDILQSFDQILPKHFMTVDNYGRITSTDWNTSQKETATLPKTNPLSKDIQGDVFAQVDTIEEMKNQWLTLHLDGDVDKPTLTIHHNFQPVTNTEDTFDMNEVEDKDNDLANVVNFITSKVDAMGHTVGTHENKVTLPFGFKSIAISEKHDTDTSIGDVTTETIIADNTQDTLNIKSGNQWLDINTNVENDEIIFGHAVTDIQDETETIDFNNDVSENFVTNEITYDKAGHIVQKHSTNYILPYNFKQFNVANTGKTLTTFITESDNTLTARNAKDNFTLEIGNRWLVATAYPESNTFTLSHAAAGTATAARTKGVGAEQTPNFGGKFKVPTVGIDEAGHVALLDDSTVTLPLPSLEHGTGNIVTGLTLEAATGKITEEKANVGTLKLTEYELGDSIKAITANDTINSAFGKLQLQIQSLTSNDIKVSDDYKGTVGETVSDAIAHFIKFGGIALDRNDKNGTAEQITVNPNYTVVLENRVERLDINFTEMTDYYARYSVVFTTSKVGCTLSIPESFTWDGDEPPHLDANKKYILVTDNVTNIVTISKGVAVE